ncbi:hypothetical protein cypCar_00001430, partial [Cyprinus carpio]
FPYCFFWMSKHKLFLLRHGEGTWNKENRFCSWVDQKLSENGVVEAQECGRLLKEQGYQFDQVFTSILSRSIQTAWLVLEAMGQEWVPVTKSWRLNERHYGALIGLNRAEMALNHGEEQVKLWRRSYDITPPPIEETHPFYAEIYNDRRYNISEREIVNVTLPTGVPVLLELDEDLRPVKPRQLLGDQAKIQAAIKKVEDQGKVNAQNK